VQQPLIDLAARQLGALQVKGDAGSFIIPFAQIDHIGTDAVTVASSQVTQTPSTGGPSDALLDLEALGKLKIVDQAGTFLGTLSDVELDPASGQITGLAAHKGGLLGMGGTTTPIEASALLMVGADLVTVTAEAAATLAADERWADDGGRHTVE
jgi:sporulation protein YlmC with PRC-barrel domain